MDVTRLLSSQLLLLLHLGIDAGKRAVLHSIFGCISVGYHLVAIGCGRIDSLDLLFWRGIVDARLPLSIVPITNSELSFPRQSHYQGQILSLLR